MTQIDPPALKPSTKGGSPVWKREVLWFVVAICLITGILLVGNNHWHRHVEPELVGDRFAGPDYSRIPDTWTGREACFECHAAADSAWGGSGHDLAMQIPGPKTITADFDNATFTHFGVTSTFYRAGNKYMVRTDGPDGSLADYEIAYVFGYYPIEQFLILFPDGRLQALNVCWDTHSVDEGGQRWFHLYPDDETPAGDLFHWTGMLQNWNYMCSECHSTDLRREYDAEHDTYTTAWSELNVSCEACHGLGSRHITWERANAQGLRPRDEAGTRGLVVDLKSPDQGVWLFEPDKPTAVRSEPLSSHVEVESCARCHARRAQLTLDYQYGRSFFDNFRLILLEEALYAADGQNQDEVYVYGSFLQSKMYAAGVTCSDCHNYHSTETFGIGNQVCAKCHRAEIYDTPEHHFHQMGKGGDSCLDCHQQARKVMVVDARRDHSFRIPRPDLSLELGTPNACSDCHDGESLQWAQDAIVEWYGDNRLQGPHYAVALQAGRTGSPGALNRLRFLVNAEDQPGIARATALSLLVRYAQASEVPEAVKALRHNDPLIRGAAVRALASSPPERQLTLALPLVQDKVLDVRVAAAGIVAGLPMHTSGSGLDSAVVFAHDLWRNHLQNHLERPETRLMLAAQNIVLEEYDLAVENFRIAMKLEPHYSTTYVNYADFLRRQDHWQEAKEVLEAGIVTATEPADIHHALGLLLVTGQDKPGALVQLEMAALQRPRSARYGYVFAVALYDAGEVEGSLAALEGVLRHNPWDRDSLLALAMYALEQGQAKRAMGPARQLLELEPEDARIQELLALVESSGGRE